VTGRFDVMLPFYGEISQFRAAVDSVRAQTDEQWRLVCVDDHYPSLEPRDWLLSLNDPRIEYIRNDENLGVARNFSRCLSLVRSDHFVVMGGDDVMLPDYLATVQRIARRHPEADVIQPGVAVIDEDGRPARPLADRVKAALRPRVTEDERVLDAHEMAASLIRADWAYFPSITWRTRSAQAIGFDHRYEIALDLALLMDIALGGGSMVISDDVCFLYRRHRASASAVTASAGLRFAQERELFDAYARRFDDVGWHDAARIARRRVVSRLNAGSEVASALIGGRPRQAGRLLRYVLG